MLPKAERTKRKPEVKNMLIYGEPLTGKTTFADKLHDKSVILSTDNNYRHLDIPHVDIKTADEIVKVISELKNDKSFECVLIDLTEDFLNLVRRHTLKNLGLEYEGDGDHGQAWDRSNIQQIEMIKALASLPQKVIFISHASRVEKTNKLGIKEISYIPNVREKFLNILIGRCQMVLRSYVDNNVYYVETHGANFTGIRLNVDIDANMKHDEFVAYYKKEIN